jgi:plastocyanin
MRRRTESPPGRRGGRLAVVLAFVALLCAAGAAEAQTPRTVTVSMSARAFQPAVVRVAPGTTVRWVNRDRSTHTTTGDIVTIAPSDGYWASGRLGAGGSFAKSFGEPGSWSYHCDVHPWMRGTVQVTAPPRPTATPTRRPPPTPTPTRRPEPPAAVTCRNWTATRDRMPSIVGRGSRSLFVTGTCDAPTAGYSVQLRYTQQGFNPAYLMLEKVVLPPRFAAAPVRSTIRVTYRQTSAIDGYRHVTILPDGATVPVGDVW